MTSCYNVTVTLVGVLTRIGLTAPYMKRVVVRWSVGIVTLWRRIVKMNKGDRTMSECVCGDCTFAEGRTDFENGRLPVLENE